MYYYLKGKVVEQTNESVILDVNGVGYQILVMHPEDFILYSDTLIYVSYIVREDEQYFVGFKSLREKDVFSKLITCKGIGPKTAINALRDISLDEFFNAIANSDVKRLKKLSGIGPKAASQIILDLQGVLAISNTESSTKLNKAQEDAKQALKTLGFKVKDIEDCLKAINDDSLTTEEYITQALRIIRK